MNKRTLEPTRFGLISLVAALLCGLASHALLADELEKLGLPVFFGEDDDGYGLIISEYEATSKGKFDKKKEIEHEIEFEGLIRPSEDDDVIAFLTTLETAEARTEDGDDVYAGSDKSKRELYSAVIARPEFMNKKGEPLKMAFIELSKCMLDKPGSYVEELELKAYAVIAEDRESEEFPAVVADRFLDVGHNVAIQVTAMEVKAKGMMTVKLDVKRSGGKGDTIVDSLYALNADGEIIGGGRWINELDIFARNCEYEMALFLDEEVTISKFKVVLATEYEIVPEPIVVEKLYQ